MSLLRHKAVLLVQRELLAQRASADCIGPVIDQHDNVPIFVGGRYRVDHSIETSIIAIEP
jgi:hypothetical protein